MKIQSLTTLFPRGNTMASLCLTGASVGPIVDTLHNQCLLEYTVFPIQVHFSLPSFLASDASSLIIGSASSSWLIPPLLGLSYVVLGGFLPRWIEATSSLLLPRKHQPSTVRKSNLSLKDTAVIAVLSTATIIRLSEYLQTTYNTSMNDEYALYNLMVMFTLAFVQWLVLDGTPVALVAALLTSVGGPLCELPFIASGCWHYIPSAADYYPLRGLVEFLVPYYQDIDTYGLSNLALSSITGPCYFAVTTDAIALGRWFDDQSRTSA